MVNYNHHHICNDGGGGDDADNKWEDFANRKNIIIAGLLPAPVFNWNRKYLLRVYWPEIRISVLYTLTLLGILLIDPLALYIGFGVDLSKVLFNDLRKELCSVRCRDR